FIVILLRFYYLKVFGKGLENTFFKKGFPKKETPFFKKGFPKNETPFFKKGSLNINQYKPI
ncbi:MAG: hypothetical protein IJO52_00100, partial [Clostridia bacterium]|nr:hypothetical protein [Clostridia bacterium]